MWQVKNNIVLFVLLTFFPVFALSQEISLKIKAPSEAVVGKQFRVSYTLMNGKGRNFRLVNPEKHFELILGPSVSTMSSTHVEEGERKVTFTETYTYTLRAEKEGKYMLPKAIVEVDGKSYSSKAESIRILSDGSRNKKKNTTKGVESISDSSAFIRTIVEKVRVGETDAFYVAFRLYTTLELDDIGDMDFPSFDGFRVEPQGLGDMTYERYQGNTYYAVDMKRVLLFPEKSGTVSISGGHAEIVFLIESDEVEETFWGPVRKKVRVKKSLPIKPFTIDVGLVGDWKLATFESKDKVTIKLL